MSIYKVHISIDGENFFWIIVENKKIINKNPSKEELAKITTRVHFYNKTNICPICKENNNITDNSILYPKNALCEIDKNRNQTGERICKSCYGKNRRKNDPYCIDNVKKSLSDRRTENQNQNHQNYIGDLCEETTCIWRKVDNLNIVYDNYEYPVDHSRNPELGILQTKGRSYDPYRGCWEQNFLSLHNTIMKGFEFDNLIFYCLSKNRKLIERIYIIPKEEIIKRNSIKIVKNNSRNIGWYEKYRTIDVNVLKKVNDIWKEINNSRGINEQHY